MYIQAEEIYMEYFDWNSNGRLDCIDTAAELIALEEIQKHEGSCNGGSTCYNLAAAVAVVGALLSILSFLG